MKRLLAIAMMAVVLVQSVPIVYADDTVIIQQPSNVEVKDSEEVNIQSDDVLINANTVTINIKDGARLINGTVLRNLNLIVEKVLYKPKIDLSVNIANILKTDDYKFGTVARNEYLLKGDIISQEGSTSVYDNSSTETEIVLSKEKYILGGDISVAKENLAPVGKPSAYEYDRFEYSYTDIFEPKKLPDSEDVYPYARREDAIMMIYKALGDNQFKHTFYHSKYKLINNPTYVEIGKSPFMELVPDVFAGITADRYYTYVYSTRTLPNAYWANAVTDAIILDTADRNEPMSLGEFARLVYDKLDREGEPVLTPEEVEMMLVAHGRKLPLYLGQDELDAVKHLVARGIVETSMDFKSLYMKESDALLILSRAKDVNSRLTFKNVEYSYIPEIVQQGFYPTEMELSMPVIEASYIQPIGETPTPTHYDYFVYAETINFKTTTGRLEQKLFVKKTDGTVIPGSTVESAVLFGQKFYWVRIPIDAKSSGQQLQYINTEGVSTSGTFFILDSISSSDSPNNYLIEEGGGVYAVVAEGNKVFRSPFPDVYDENRYFDKERATTKTSSSNQLRLYGSTDKSIKEYEFIFKSPDPTILLWDGKPLSDYQVEGKYPRYSKVADQADVYSIKVKTANPEQYIMRYLTYGSKAGAKEMVKAYVSDSKVALVSSKWLMKTGLLTGVVEIVPGKSYLLYSKTDNTVIDITDPEKRRIISGQVVTEIDKLDKSPVIVKDNITGEFLIDYRAVLNFSGDYMTVSDDNGNISLTIADNPRAQLGTSNGGTYNANMNSVYDLFGEGVNKVKVKSDSIPGVPGAVNSVALSDTYVNANWIIYRKRSGGLYSDTLLVFRPSTKELQSNISVSRTARSERETINDFISKYGIMLRNYIDVGVFSLNDWIFQAEADSALRRANESHGIIVDKATGKYYYTPPKVTTYAQLKEVYDDYMSASVYSQNTGRIKYALPLVNYNGVLVNLNSNLFIQNGTATELKNYPSVLLNEKLKQMSVVNTLTSSITGSVAPKASDFILAVAGAQSMYYPYQNATWLDAKKSIVYLGSMRGSVVYSDSAYGSYGEYLLSVNGVRMGGVPGMQSMGAPFKEIFRGSNSTVLSYGVTNGFELVDPTTQVNWDSVGFSKSLLESIGESLSIDLDDYRVKESLELLDNGLSILNIIALSIIPRLMLFLFIAFITLALVADNRLVRMFAAKVFDPFKLISLGYTSIEHVTAKNAWISVTIAIVFLAMTANTFTQIIAWLLRFFQALLTL